MTQPTSTKIRNMDWFAIGVVATLLGAAIWPPLGLIISAGTLAYALKSRKLSLWPVRGSVLLVVAMVLLTGGYVGALFSTHSSVVVSTSAPIGKTEAERVQKEFKQMSVDVALKDRVKSVKLNPVRAGAESYLNGTKASVWVTGPTPKGIRSRCFYIDVTGPGSVFGLGQSACGGPGGIVSLNRVGPIVVGDIGTLPAVTVLVRVGVTVQLPVTSGYFVVPSALSSNPNTTFTITMMNKAGKSIGMVTDLVAPGSATPK